MLTNQAIVEGLEKAKAQIGTPDKWVQNSWGLDADGRNMMRSQSADMARMCLTSAMDVAASGNTELWLAMGSAIAGEQLTHEDHVTPGKMCKINNADDRDYGKAEADPAHHAALMAKLDAAIESLKVPA